MLEGQSIVCVSDAGMPAISDPGADLVTKAIEEGITVVPLPGANAALTALIASGLDTKSFALPDSYLNGANIGLKNYSDFHK